MNSGISTAHKAQLLGLFNVHDLQLSRLEGKVGTAERPLSDLGAVSFKSYWTKAVLDVLRDSKNDISVQVRRA
jgi:hypothetical protein